MTRFPVALARRSACVLASFVIVSLALHAGRSEAQITLDGSLHAAGPVPKVNGTFAIGSELGQVRGPNLFHSFGLFNLQNGESASFSGPGPISNVISRVTGGPSFIDGSIRSTIPNFYLLNPQGVMFGSHASLAVSGSFHVSTADYLRLRDNVKFSARPVVGEILTMAEPVAFGFLGPSAAAISMSGGSQSQLQVNQGKTLSIVGGDLHLSGGALSAPGGRVQLASVASAGEVILSTGQQAPDLGVSSFARQGRIDITGKALIDTSGTPGGTVLIRAGQLVVDNSVIRSNTSGTTDGARLGIDVRVTGDMTLGNGTLVGTSASGLGRAGDTKLTATSLKIDGASSRVENCLASSASCATTSLNGRFGGDVVIDVSRLSLTGGASIRTTGNSFNLLPCAAAPPCGQAGNVTISATDSISLSGASSGFIGTTMNVPGGRISISTPSLSMDTGALIAASTTLRGPGGNVVADVGSLTVTGGAQIATQSVDLVRAGDITVNAAGTITVTGGLAGTPSGINTNSIGRPGAGGRAGEIVLNARDVILSGGAVVQAGSIGTPKQGGDVTVTATDAVVISGGATLSSQARDTDVGHVRITAPTVTLDHGFVAASTIDKGRAGDIEVSGQTLTLTAGGKIITSTLAPGSGGNIVINETGTVSISGQGPPPPLSFFGVADPSSGLFSTTSRIAIGPAGRIAIFTPTLTLGNDGKISVASDGRGAAGDISAKVGALSLASGGELVSSTTGAGKGGTVTVSATDVMIGGTGASGAASGLFSTASSTGDAGLVQLSAGTLELGAGGTISVATSGAGRAGDISASVGRATLTEGGRVESGTTGSGPGGAIVITAAGAIAISGGAGLFSTSDGTGAGGNITVNVPQVGLTSGGIISAKSSRTGDAGTVSITAGNALTLRDSEVTTQALQGDGGNIAITAGSLLRLVNSQITTSVESGRGKGGNITIDPEFVVLNRSHIHADAFGGPGGNVKITAGVFLIDPESSVTASSATNVPGTIEIQASFTDVSGTVARLPEATLQAANLFRASCAARFASGKASSLVVAGREGVPVEPGHLLSSPPLPLEGLAAEGFGRGQAAHWGALATPARFLADSKCAR
jgi:filamentous hemagglutinin family protein